MDGDFYLIDGNNQYRLLAYHNLNSEGFYCFSSVSEETNLDYISLTVREAMLNKPEYRSFNAINAYVITWIIRKGSNYTFYQVVLCKDGRSAFMIINYKLLQIPSDSSKFLTDSNQNKIYFDGSTSGSNCGVPGQFVFSLN
jgi:hypothetical protein